MNSPPTPPLKRYHFDFSTLTDDDLVTVWNIHQRFRVNPSADDIVTIGLMAIKYSNMESIPLLQLGDVILAFYSQLADDLGAPP